MTEYIKLGLHVFLCAAIIWSCFCRQQASTLQTTRRDIRTAFALLGSATLWFCLAPFAPDLLWPSAETYRPDWPGLALLGSVAALQIITAKQWRTGVPRNFRAKPNRSNRS